MDGYIVLTGNEFGINIEEEVEFISYEEAEKLYETYLEEYGCAVMYEFTGFSIILKKKKYNF